VFYLNEFGSFFNNAGLPNSFDDAINSGNHWLLYDAPSEGCVDLDNNDKCDSPYNIIGGGIDNYPLVQGRIDLAPRATDVNPFGIEPIQSIRGVPLISGKKTMFRSFIDLLNENSERQFDLNTLNNDVRLEATFSGLSGSQERAFYFHNWYDYNVNNPTQSNVRTYVLSASIVDDKILQDYKNFVKTNDLDGVRKLVFQNGIDAANFYTYGANLFQSNSPASFSINIDTFNEINENKEYNNNPSPQEFEVRKINPNISFRSFKGKHPAFNFNLSDKDLWRQANKQWKYLISTFPVPSDLPFKGSSPLLNTPIDEINLQDPNLSQGESCNLPNTITKKDIDNCLSELQSFRLYSPPLKTTYDIIYFPESVLSPLGLGGIAAAVGSNVAFVNEESTYETLTHEMSHEFGVMEQYIPAGWGANLVGIGIEKEWYDVRNTNPYGLLAVDGWDATGFVVNDFKGPYTRGPYAPKISTKKFDATQGKNGLEQFNHYSFMGNKITGVPSLWNDGTATFDRWIDKITMQTILPKLTIPITNSPAN
ncbi:MAG: hypothetical protein Q7R33_09755, partial [Nitrosarchaeum sp.]|nr:hypothetical protein [Nitrosarchaeum sp.]